MNYEEKYNIALANAEAYHNITTNTEVKNWLEYAFPELKESENEKIRKQLIKWVEMIRNANPDDSEHDIMCSKTIAWLEKQEEKSWSEEDEKMLTSTVEYLNEFKEVYQKGAQECIAWLKSLNLQPRWKPTENQMSKLLAVIHDGNNANSESCHIVLQSLYNDLKSL